MSGYYRRMFPVHCLNDNGDTDRINYSLTNMISKPVQDVIWDIMKRVKNGTDDRIS